MESYDIIDMDKFVEVTRTLVYSNFGEKKEQSTINDLLRSLTDEEINEMNCCLSQIEAKNIIQEFVQIKRHKYTGETKYVMSEQSYMDYVNELNSRLVSNMLAKLASQGVLETAFDEEANDFVFWVKDNKNEKD